MSTISLPSGALSQVGMIAESLPSKGRCRLLQGGSTAALQAMKNSGQRLGISPINAPSQKPK